MTARVMLVAFIRSSRQMAVTKALQKLGASGWTEGLVTGHGGAIGSQRAVPYLRIEAFVSGAEEAETYREAISAAAHTGLDGDGLIALVSVLSVHPISGAAGGLATPHEKKGEGSWSATLVRGLHKLMQHGGGTCYTVREIEELLLADKANCDRASRESSGQLRFSEVWNALGERARKPLTETPSRRILGVALRSAHNQTVAIKDGEDGHERKLCLRMGSTIDGYNTWWIGAPDAPVPKRARPTRRVVTSDLPSPGSEEQGAPRRVSSQRP